MKNRALIKTLKILVIIFLAAALFYQEALARDNDFRRGNKGYRGVGRSYYRDYGRHNDEGFVYFRIGNVVVKLPLEYENDRTRYCYDGPRGRYYPNYIIVPAPCH